MKQCLPVISVFIFLWCHGVSGMGGLAGDSSVGSCLNGNQESYKVGVNETVFLGALDSGFQARTFSDLLVEENGRLEVNHTTVRFKKQAVLQNRSRVTVGHSDATSSSRLILNSLRLAVPSGLVAGSKGTVVIKGKASLGLHTVYDSKKFAIVQSDGGEVILQGGLNIEQGTGGFITNKGGVIRFKSTATVRFFLNQPQEPGEYYVFNGKNGKFMLEGPAITVRVSTLVPPNDSLYIPTGMEVSLFSHDSMIQGTWRAVPGSMTLVWERVADKPGTLKRAASPTRYSDAAMDPVARQYALELDQFIPYADNWHPNQYSRLLAYIDRFTDQKNYDKAILSLKKNPEFGHLMKSPGTQPGWAVGLSPGVISLFELSLALVFVATAGSPYLVYGCMGVFQALD
ncbi:MAG: hypothetical protein ACR2PT_01460 [Endozoicomonas sp.]